jgi:DNA replication protein DnaC
MNALIDQFEALRLHGMAACAQDLLAARTPPSLTTALKTLIEAETEERRVRSIQYQMRIAKFPHHKDFATFDYGAATVTKAQIDPFCSGQFFAQASSLMTPITSFLSEELALARRTFPSPSGPVWSIGASGCASITLSI